MPEIWLTADTHFGHANIIEYCDRPFDSVEEMDEHLIEAWNDVVDPGDTVYHLGDFCFTWGLSPRPADLVRRLNGRIHLLKGNHDRLKHWDPEPDAVWIRERDQFSAPHGRGHVRIFIDHYAVRCWPGRFHGGYHAFGHSHGTLDAHPGTQDVGVDSAAKLLGEYRPFTVEEFIHHAQPEAFEAWVTEQKRT